MKLGRVDIGEAVRRFLYGARFGEVAREALSVVRLVLSSVWHVRRDVHQTNNRRVGPGFGKYGSPVAMSDKNARTILQSEDAFGGGNVVFKGRLRFLDDADIVAVLDENIVNALPPRTIGPRAVDQNNIPNAMLLVLRRERATAQ